MSDEILMIDDSDVVSKELLLQHADYPDNFVNMAHPFFIVF